MQNKKDIRKAHVKSVHEYLMMLLPVIVVGFFLCHGTVKAATASISCAASPTITQGSSFIEGDDLTLTTSGTCTLSGTSSLTSLTIDSGVTLKLADSITLTISGATSITGTLTFGSGDTVNGATNITVNSGGNINHSAYTGTVSFVPQVNINISGTLTVSTGGTINVNGLGYLGANQSGNSGYYGRTNGNTTTGGSYSSYASGSHGGRGGNSTTIAVAYDSITNPVLPGGGGGCYSYIGLNGGGVITIVAAALTVDGTMSAIGNSAVTSANYYAGMGAGGTVNLTVSGTLSGSGTISAAGGNGDGSYYNYTGAGGGRVAIVYGTNSFGAVGTKILANGGDGSGTTAGYDGSAGTIYLKQSAATYGDLYIDNLSHPYAYYPTDITSSNATTFANVYLQNYGILFSNTANFVTTLLKVPTNSVFETSVAMTWPALSTSYLYLNGGTVQFDSGATATFTEFDTTSGAITGALVNFDTTYVSSGTPILGSGLTWSIGGTFQKSAGVALDSVTVKSGGILTTPTSTTSNVYTLNLTAPTITVDSGGTISVNGKGYMGGNQIVTYYSQGISTSVTNSGSCGRTNGNTTTGGSCNSSSSGSHGGKGGYTSGATIAEAYDSITNPTLPGGGGGVYSYKGLPGGGVITVVATTVTINGTMSANGDSTVTSVNYYSGMGAGGTVNMTVSGTLSGSGTISAVGGNGDGSYYNYVGAGGGRVAIVYGTNSFGAVGSKILANGGDGSGTTAGYDGAAGTIYLKQSAATYGDLYVDNLSHPYAYYPTDITSSNATTFANTYIQNYAKVYIQSSGTSFATTLLKIGSNCFFGSNIAMTWPSATTTTFYLNGGTAQFDTTVTFTAFDTTSGAVTGTLNTNGTVYVSSGTPVIGNALTWSIGSTFQKSAGVALDSVTVKSGGILTTPESTTSTVYSLSLTTTALTVDSGGTISVNGKGYMGAGQIVTYYSQGISTSVTNTGSYGRTNGNTTTGGSSSSSASGSHGGRGGYYSGSITADAYDSITNPTLPGGGGGVYSYKGLPGGGVITVVATTVTVNGTMSANGDSTVTSVNYYSGMGAGGTVNLTVSGTLSGSGTISAVGGNGDGSYYNYTGAGGGRVAIVYGTNSFGAVGSKILANGGDGYSTTAGYDGAAGTIYLKQSAATYGDLYVDNLSRPYAYFPTLITSSDATTFTNTYLQNYGRLFVMNGATSFATTLLKIPTNCYFESGIVMTWPALSTTSLYLNGGMATFWDTTTFTAIDTTSGEVTGTLQTAVAYITSGAPIIGSGLTLQLVSTLQKSTGVSLDSMTVKSGGTVTTMPATALGTPFSITVGTLTVDTGGVITATGLGYRGARQTQSYYISGVWLSSVYATNYGRTDGGTPIDGYAYKDTETGGSAAYSGGSHGGRGGYTASNVVANSYDSIVNPVLPGGGGGSSSYTGGNGGGAITISATTAIINGTISSNGNGNTNYYSGAGAGGTVNMTVTGTLSGTGTISAVGGDATSNTYTGGGGGRIAIVYGTNSFTTTIGTTIKANGGDGSATTAGYDGAAGTIFLKSGSSTYGDLYITNASRPYAYYTTDLLTTVPTSDQLLNGGYTFNSVNFSSYGVLTIPSEIDSVSDGSANANRKFASNSCPTDNDTLSDGEIVYNTAAYGSATADYTCVSLTPSSPTTLYSDNTDASSGSANPVNLTASTPVFTAICNSSVGSCLSANVQVSTNSAFSSTVWDSGSLDIADIANGVRSANITYAGSALSFGTTYYWRIRFYGTNGAGMWSTETATFYLPRSMELYSFNLGGAVQVGQSVDILWGSVGGATGETVKIEYSKDDFVSDVHTVTASVASAPDATAEKSYSWTIPNDVTTTAKIRITSNSDANTVITSNENFTIQSGASTNGIKLSRTFTNSSFYTAESGISFSQAGAEGWYDVSWLKRKAITVTNNVASTLTNFQTQITVTYDSSMQADFDDIRFTSSDETTLIDHWLESKTDSSTATFWVEVPSIPSSSTATIYMYYGNSGASSTSSIANTFLFGDDFSSGTLDETKWTTNQNGTITSTVSGGALAITGSTGGWVYSSEKGSQHQATNLSTLDNIIMEWSGNVPSASDMSEVGLGLVSSTGNVTAFLSQGDWGGSSQDLYHTLSYGSSYTHIGNNSTGSHPLMPETRTFKLLRSGTSLKAYVDGTLYTTQTMSGTPTKMAIIVANYSGYTFRPTNLDDIRVRQYIATEPSTSFGTAEDAPVSVANSKVTYTNSSSGAAWYDSTPAERTVTWYDASWSRRKALTITNANATTLTNFQTQITVTYDSDMQADFDDIRFTSSDGTTLIDQWLESKTNSSTASIWVEVPSITASSTATIYMYYGNGSAVSVSNGANTFLLFEDFETGTFDSSYWTAGGSISPYWQTYTTKYYQGTYSGGNNNITSNQSSWIKRTITVPSTAVLEFYWGVESEGNYDYLYYCINNDTCTKDSSYVARISGGTFSWAAKSQTLSAGSNSIKFGYGKDGSVDTGSDTGYLDAIKVRQTATSTPTASAGSEEPYEIVDEGTWGYRKIVTFTSSSAIIPASQTNFPVLVNLTSDADLAAHAQSNGNDILFTDSSGNKLSHEIESYTSATGALVAWVNVTTLSTSGQILMYYGNATASNQQSATSVWDSNYKMVQHMTTSSVTHTDSTTNGKNGTAGASVTRNATGKIGSGDQFSANDDIDFSGTIITAFPVTVSYWVNYTNKASNGVDYFFHMDTSNWVAGGLYGGYYLNNTAAKAFSNSYFTSGAWAYVTAVYNTASDITTYVNGSAVTPTSYDTWNHSATSSYIGSRAAGYYLNGYMDEFRVSGSVRSANWVTAEYNNQNSPSTFYTLGSEEAYDPNPTSAKTIVPTAGHVFTSAINGFAATVTGTGNVKFQVSNDNGSTWKYCVVDTLTSATAGYTHSNTAAEITDACLTGLTAGTFSFRAYLNATGGQTVSLSNISIYSAGAAAPPAGPDATGFTNSTDGTITDGGRVSQTIVVTGSGFGTVSAGSDRANCAGSTGTGCIKIGGIAGDTIAYGDISAWSDTSITLTLTNVASYGGATDSGLVVYAAGTADLTPLTFYVYPHVTSLTVPTAVPNAAREYSADDTDGIITINGDHFGTAGTVQVFVSTATQQVTGTCAGTAYQETCIGIRIPTTAAAYSAGLTITLSSPNTKTATYDLRILPRITAVLPTSGSVGATIKITGSHFCQDTSCPTSPNRSTVDSHVDFGSTQAADGDFVNSGSSPCSGNAQAWMNGEICVNVPSATPGGSQPVKVTSSTYTSNTISWGGYEASGYIVSSTFDTATTHGAAPNSIMWKGTLPSTAHVKFQIASSNSVSGPWSYLGSDGTGGTYYEPSAPNTPIKISLTNHNNHRYFKYKMFLEPTNDTAESPTVTDVIFNWSP